MFAFYLIFVVLAAAVGVSFWFSFRYLRRKRLLQDLNLKLLLIRLPRVVKKEEQQKDFKYEVNFSAQLFGILAGLKSPFVFEAAVHNVGEEIHFYIAAPRESVEFVSRQIEGLWKDASIEPVDDYNIFNPAGASTGVYLKQKISYALPLRTYVEANIDTFAPVLSGLSKINEVGEGAAIQILAKPAPKSASNSIIKIIEAVKKGTSLKDALGGEGFINLKDIQKALNPEKEEDKKEKTIDEEAVKTLEAKISKPLLSINARVLVSAPSQFQADSILESVAGAFGGFGAPKRQEIKIVKPRGMGKLAYQFSFREFDDNQAMILNTEELASLFHLPASSTEIPKIKWLKAKEAEPPANLPQKGTLIGENIFRGRKKPVYITDDDRRRHIYIIGQTGTGKTTLMENMILEDVKLGKGVCVIDPHSGLTERILSLMPKSRIEDVILFNPGDLERPLGLNMLEYDFSKPEQKTFIVDEMQGIFNKLFPESGEAMGPVFQQYMRNTLLLLMEDAANEPATLMEVARVFTDVDFRKRKLARIKNPVVFDFWEREVSKVKGEAALENMAPYITSKFNNFTANDYVRPIVGQVKSAFNFRQIMDEGKILLVNLSKGRIGDLNANLLGMIIVGKILMAALSRVDVGDEKKRRDFNLYIDEFQNFTTDSIAVILSEARKYRLNLTVAHQFIAQLTEKIRDAVFGNVGSVIGFRVGAPDTELLVKQFTPVFSENDLINIDNFNACAKILINGQPSRPFNIRIFPPQKESGNLTEKIKEISRLKYGRDRREVEEEILKRLRQ